MVLGRRDDGGCKGEIESIGKGVKSVGKFLGVGLTNAVGIAVFTILLIVLLKVIMVKYPVPGVTDVVATV